MVAAAGTAPIERIPLQKDEGGRKRPKVRTRTATPPLHSRTIAPPLHGPHGRLAAAQPSKKARGPQKAAAPNSLLFAAEATFAALTPVFAHRARCRIDAPRSPG